MIIIVDKHNGKVVQKVKKPDGTALRWQVAPEAGGDSTQVIPCASLAEGRKLIGKHPTGKGA